MQLLIDFRWRTSSGCGLSQLWSTFNHAAEWGGYKEKVWKATPTVLRKQLLVSLVGMLEMRVKW